jgi:predicted AlkP superfamily pyrophosphatase or phosphodiesterase
MKNFLSVIFTALLGASPAFSQSTASHPVVMISVDGLRPSDILRAREQGMSLPILTGFVKDGAYATGVRNALATQTYPNHIALITGVWPRKHGVGFNAWFDPYRKPDVRPWAAGDIKVPTLFDAVHQAGGNVASFGWPVTAGSHSIDENIPEYGRVQHPEDIAMATTQITPGLLPRLERETKTPFKQVYGEFPSFDAARAQYVIATLKDFHPRLLAVHMTSIDKAQHIYGPGKPEDFKALEQLDGQIGAIIQAARQAQPNSIIAVVSDHGFAAVQHDVELGTAFVQAGLITLDKNGQISAWEAQPWATSGSYAVILARPDDAALKAKVAALLGRVTADPKNGLGQVIDDKQIAALGGSSQASFWVDCRFGYEPGQKLTGDMVVAPANGGTHGYLPWHPEMRASFFIEGPGIPKGKSLGEIDIRDVAPTLAKLAGASLPSADGKPLF